MHSSFPWQYSDGDPLTEASNAGGVSTNRDCPRIAGYRSMTVRTTSATIHCAVYRTVGDASVILYLPQHARPRLREENRTEFICTQR